MPKIKFLPMDIEVEVDSGTSVLDAALDHSIPIQHACGGFCACTTCHILVKEGKDSLEPMGEEEEERISTLEDLTEESRLGCQSKVTGDVVVQVVNLEN
ncbi:MAG: 2Fe-2S ferredoxin [Bdellovibrionaceae bacterium]|nr:2Fe-2S ferredoxin [Pseudobdellovibrionaceae bacterium]